jgi:predicted hydrocarbon binding protein
VRQTVSEDAEAYYLTPERCLVCAHVHDAHAPLCNDAEALYSSLAKNLVGRVRIAEVECAAMGDPHCKFAFYK